MHFFEISGIVYGELRSYAIYEMKGDNQMSESRAKKARKQQSENVKVAQKKSPMEKLMSVVAVIVVVAVAGLGAYALKETMQKALIPQQKNFWLSVEWEIWDLQLTAI